MSKRRRPYSRDFIEANRKWRLLVRNGRVELERVPIWRVWLRVAAIKLGF